ncbi:hypothetical protein BO70DRAFT_101588 [Aspergillus heteromorphus CBS 117.55]|uniref:Uncharacterized protein n=1 Tax=Aspergillus heteromorphus CBS 117.55 TaxID=1448321 RepID=A0A317VQE7_9EURO|nr:uncharacterized protein BO70DRAFT_101588 [Aspergillus heteromorphus CBS 117.55]PWY75112.1 hypothetical protein BO70DRAFT_101588 [Aspergillus heteromorphus CBS 117.55]
MRGCYLPSRTGKREPGTMKRALGIPPSPLTIFHPTLSQLRRIVEAGSARADKASPPGVGAGAGTSIDRSDMTLTKDISQPGRGASSDATLTPGDRLELISRRTSNEQPIYGWTGDDSDAKSITRHQRHQCHHPL